MKYIYELIGTFFLVFTVGMTVVQPNNVGMFAPLAIGSALAVMVFAGGHVSGGHYNPAVSFAAYLNDKLNAKDLVKYWIVQVLGGIIAAWLTLYFKGGYEQAMVGFDPVKLFLGEFLFTFALCFVVLNVAYSKETKGNSFYGFAIGFTVLFGAYAMGSVSGGAFNPAVAIGIAMMNLTMCSNLWVFIAANLLGAACAARLAKKA